MSGRLLAATPAFRAKRSPRAEARSSGDRRDLRRRRSLRGHARSRRMGQHSAPRLGDRSAGTRVSRRPLRWHHRALQFDRGPGYRMPTGSRCLRQRGAGDADDLRALPEGTCSCARRDMGNCDEQELRPDGRQQTQGVRRPVLRQRRAPEAAVDRDDQVGREHGGGARRRRSAGARRAHDARTRRGVRRVRVEGLRVGSRAWGRA